MHALQNQTIKKNMQYGIAVITTSVVLSDA